LLRYYPNIKFEDIRFHLVEAMGRIMPEVSLKTSEWVLANLDKRNAKVHLNTQLESAKKGVIKLSTGESFESDLVIWTAGVAAHAVAKNTDFPLDPRFRITAKATLQIVDGEKAPGLLAMYQRFQIFPVEESAATVSQTPSTPCVRASCFPRT
jgi:NADH dehydrogenase